MTWTSKWRWPIVRLAASRTHANASGSRSSSDSPASSRCRNSAVFAWSSASEAPRARARTCRRGRRAARAACASSPRRTGRVSRCPCVALRGGEEPNGTEGPANLCRARIVRSSSGGPHRDPGRGAARRASRSLAPRVDLGIACHHDPSRNWRVSDACATCSRRCTRAWIIAQDGGDGLLRRGAGQPRRQPGAAGFVRRAVEEGDAVGRHPVEERQQFAGVRGNGAELRRSISCGRLGPDADAQPGSSAVHRVRHEHGDRVGVVAVRTAVQRIRGQALDGAPEIGQGRPKDLLGGLDGRVRHGPQLISIIFSRTA